MRGISSSNSAFEILAEKAEEIHRASVAICTTSWHLPIHRQSITYTTSSTRRASAIEEYIMKLANLDVSFDIEKSMLPDILGLDECFTDDALSHLLSKNILDTKAFPQLKLTETGESLLKQGLVFDKEQSEEVSYYINLKTAHVYSKPAESEAFSLHPDYARIETGVENIKKYINRKFIKEVCNTIGKGADNSQEDGSITSIVSAKTGDAQKTLFTEILMYDLSENKCFIKVWDHAALCFRDDLAKMLEKLGAKTTYSFEISKLPEHSEFINNLGEELNIYRGDKRAKVIADTIQNAREYVCIRTDDILHLQSFGIYDALRAKAEAGIKVSVFAKKITDIEGVDDFKDFDKYFEITQSDECTAFEITTDYKTKLISAPEFVKCSGDFTKCEDAMFCIND